VGPKRHAAAARLEGKLVLDGKLDDAAWERAPVNTGFEMPLGVANRKPIPDDAQTSFRVLYDDSTIYFGIRCNEPKMNDLVVQAARQHDAAMWSDDDVELFFDPVGSVFRALALVHRYEDFFKNGEVRIDVPAYIQFRDKPFDKLRAVSMVEPLPIVRRVRYGNYHLVATYDPSSDPNQAGRDVTIRDFDGRPGIYVTLPSAGEVKLFLLRLDSAKSSRP
jgi:hypothetical protein